MPLPRWLLRLIPRLAPRGTWADAVRVTDARTLARFHVLYAETVAWCRAWGFAIQSPDCRVTLRYWPDELRAPKDFGIGKVLAPNVISGDEYGTMLLRRKWLGAEWLMRHEAFHAITGNPMHPETVFNPDGTLKDFPNG